MSLQLILRNIISPYYIRTLRGKLPPPTSHRFTLSVLDSHRDPPHIALQWKAVPGWLGPPQKGPRGYEERCDYVSPSSSTLYASKIGTVSHASDKNQLAIELASPNYWKLSLDFITLRDPELTDGSTSLSCYLLLTDSNVIKFFRMSNFCCI